MITLGALLAELGPHARAATAQEAAERDQPAYVVPQNREELLADLAKAHRATA